MYKAGIWNNSNADNGYFMLACAVILQAMEDYTEIGTPEREAFEMECDASIIGEQLKDERLKAGLT